MKPHILKTNITIWLCAIAVLLAGTLNGQHRETDSIRSLIKSPPRDTTDVRAMVSLSMALFHETNFDSSLDLAIAARKLAQKLRDQRGIGMALLASGYVYKLQGSYSAAVNDFKEAMIIFETLQDNLNLGKSHSFLAQVFQAMGRHEEAFVHLLEAKTYVEKLGHLGGLSVIYLDLGRYHSERASYDVALEYYLLSLKASDSIRAYSKMAMAMNNIGVVYERLEQFEKARDYFQQGVTLTREGNIISKKALLLVNLAGINIKLNELDDAEKNATEGLQIARANGDKEYECIALRNLAKLHWKKGQEQHAEETYKASIDIAREMRNPDLIMNALFGMTEFWLDTRKNEKAKDAAREALSLAQQLKAQEFIKDLYLEHSKIDSARGDYKQAFYWRTKFGHLNDSLLVARKSAKIAYLQNLVDEKKLSQDARLLLQGAKAEPQSETTSPQYIIAILSALLLATISSLIIVFAKLKSRNKNFTEVGERVEA